MPVTAASLRLRAVPGPFALLSMLMPHSTWIALGRLSVVTEADVDTEDRRMSSPKFPRVRAIGWEVPVMLLRFQRDHMWTVAHSATARDAEDLAEIAEFESDVGDYNLTCVPLAPQPHRDFPVLVCAPFNFRQIGQIPVCFELFYAQEGSQVWMEFVDPVIRLDDIEYLMAIEWRDGSTVLVGNSLQPLGTRDVAISPGALIRILRPGGRRLCCNTLTDKLRRPDLFLRRLDVAGFPTDPHVQFRHCLLQPLAAPRLVQFSAINGDADRDRVLLSHASGEPESLVLVWPRSHTRDLVVRARNAPLDVGIFPAGKVSRIPVFVDSREVGSSFQLRAALSGTMPLSVFLQIVGLSLPDVDDLIVEGTATFAPQGRTITVRACDTVLLRYAVRSACAGGLLTQASEAVASSSGPEESDLETGRHADGLATAAGSARKRSRSRQSAVAGRPSARCNASPYSPADIWRLFGMRSYLLDEVAASVRRATALDLQIQLTCSAFADRPCVLQEQDDVPVDFRAPRPDDEAPAGDDDDAAGEAANEPPDLLCVKVAVVAFQGPTTVHSLWREVHEPVAGLLVRAEILLNPDPDFLSLAPADPQPSDDHLTLMLFPRWWHLVDMRPMLLVSPTVGGLPFITVAFPEQLTDDFLPQAALPPGVRSVAFAPPSSVRDMSAGFRRALQRPLLCASMILGSPCRSLLWCSSTLKAWNTCL